MNTIIKFRRIQVIRKNLMKSKGRLKIAGSIYVIIPLVLLLLTAGYAEPASSEKPFYEGKTVVIIVPFGPGGSTSVYSRLLARNLPRHIPGRPTIIVKNMPGAGGGMAFTHVATRAKRDGSILVFGSSGILGRWLIHSPGHDYDLRKMTMLSASPAAFVIYISSEVGASGIKDLLQRGKPLTSGHTSLDSGIAHTDRNASKLLGLDVKQIPGYSGYGEARLALLRGEVNMTGIAAAGYASEIEPMVKRGEVVPLYQGGLIGEAGDLIRDPRMPDIPTVAEVYREIYHKAPQGKAFESLKARAAVATVGISGWLPPGVPQERIDELLAAFKPMAKSPAYIKESTKVLGARDLIMVGKEAHAAFRLLAETPQVADQLK